MALVHEDVVMTGIVNFILIRRGGGGAFDILFLAEDNGICSCVCLETL